MKRMGNKSADVKKINEEAGMVAASYYQMSKVLWRSDDPYLARLGPRY